MAREFSSVTLEAEHVTEIHRTLENDHTVTEVELPGVVNLYAVFDGGRVLMDQIKAPVVLEAIDRAQASQKATADAQAAQQQTQESQTATTQPTQEPTQPTQGQ